MQRWILSRFRKLAALAKARGNVSIAIVGDTEMSRLHLRYKRIAGPTDVLTFDLRETPGAAIDGDIVICYDEARRQAKAHRHDIKLELLLYALHGLLHLMGYDDRTDRDFRRMHRREDELLRRAGLGAVFAAAISPTFSAGACPVPTDKAGRPERGKPRR